MNTKNENPIVFKMNTEEIRNLMVNRETLDTRFLDEIEHERACNFKNIPYEECESCQ